MKKAICLLLVLIMACCAVAVSAEETAPEASYDNLTVGMTTPANGSFFLDNLFGNNATDMDIRDLLHGYSLAQWEAESGSFMRNNNVISGMVVMDNPEGNRVYEIALQRDLAYSDGTPITAWDYAFSILLTVDPEMEKIGAIIDKSDRILGAAEYRKGAANRLKGVNVINDYLFTITVRGEFLPYFYELALVSYKPYPIHVIAPGCEVAQDEGGVYVRGTDGGAGLTAALLQDTVMNPDSGYLSHPSVVSGPYKLVSYDANQCKTVLTANEYYKGNSDKILPRIPNLTFVAVNNETAMAQLKNGEVDLFNKAMQVDAVNEGIEAAAEGTLAQSSYPRVGLSYISFNCEKPGVSDNAVRQAIALCFDRESFMKDYVGENGGIPVDGYYGVGQWMYAAAVAKTAAYPLPEPEGDKADYEKNVAAWDELNTADVRTYAFDVEAAKQLLDENGWVAGEDGIRAKEIDGQTVRLALKLVCHEVTGVKAGFETYLAPNLKEAGIDLQVEEKDSKALFEAYYGLTERDCDMFFTATNFVSEFDPSVTFMPGNTVNYTGIDDTELYNLAVAMRNTEPGDVVGYCAKWIAFQERFMELLPMYPVYSNVYFDFYTPELQEYSVGNMNSVGSALAEAFYGPVEEAEEPAAE